MIINMTAHELKNIRAIIEKYREIEIELTQVQMKLERLDKEKDRLITDLDSTREIENLLLEELKASYGDGQIDLYKMQYITKDDDNETNLGLDK